MGDTKMTEIKNVSILGVNYGVIKTTATADKALEDRAGYCDITTKKCVVNDFSDSEKRVGDVENIENVIRKTIRHEIIHAFLAESGLDSECFWALSEEMVDWIANQGLKIYKAWQDAGAV